MARKPYELRTRVHLRQRQLVKLVGTSPSAICQFEDTDYDGHSLSMLRRIAAGLSQLAHSVPDPAPLAGLENQRAQRYDYPGPQESRGER